MKVRPARGSGRFKALAASVRTQLWLGRCFLYDFWHYRAEAGYRRPKSRGALQASLIRYYHSVEKGLALPAPRPGFAKALLLVLISELRDYLALFGPDGTTDAVVSALRQYISFNERHQIDVSELRSALDTLVAPSSRVPDHQEGGAEEVTREEIWRHARIELRPFAESRHSIRHFSDEPVAHETIEKAVQIAQTTPSVCNRQSASVFVVTERSKMNGLLSLQNGNRGFSHQINKLLVVTSRLETFLTPDERHQQWIDGGMFAMTLVFALHSMGVGTCCLNWAVPPAVDRKLRMVSGIPVNHAIIMMIAVGHLPETFRVACSAHRPIEDVLIDL